MAAKRSISYLYLLVGLAAIAGGLVCVGIEVIGTYGYLASQRQPSYLVAGGIALTVASAGLLPLADLCWRRRLYLMAILLGVALVPAHSLVFTAAVERTGAAKDEGDRGRQVSALKLRLAEARVKEAKAESFAAEAKADAECSRTKNPKADPRGPLCTRAEERAATKAAALKAARDEVVTTGPVPKDPLAVRISAMLPWVSEEAVALYQPLILPVAIPLTGDLLIAAGAHLLMPQPSRRKRKKRKRSWWWRPKRGKRKGPGSKSTRPAHKRAVPPPLPSSAKVIALRGRKS